MMEYVDIDLTGTRALVTGGTSGPGLAMAGCETGVRDGARYFPVKYL
jgi:NAD(P)-dependent dehydrogenase (short-subunit alcohol dehydrogenase family)